jgi:hypothetical protein
MSSVEGISGVHGGEGVNGAFSSSRRGCCPEALHAAHTSRSRPIGSKVCNRFLQLSIQLHPMSRLSPRAAIYSRLKHCQRQIWAA